MKTYEVFGIVVRTMGLWLVVQSIAIFAGVFASAIVLLVVFLQAGVGTYLFFNADGVVRAAYHRISIDELEPPID